MGTTCTLDSDRRRWLGALAVAVTLAAAPAAQAEIRLHIGADAGDAASDEVVFEAPVTQASGHMFAGTSDAGGSIDEGLLGCPSTVCGPVAATPGATAAGFAFVDSRAAFTGQAVCSSSEWINGLSNPVSESYHPNRPGHVGYANLVEPVLRGAVAPAFVDPRPSLTDPAAVAATLGAEYRREAVAHARSERIEE